MEQILNITMPLLPEPIPFISVPSICCLQFVPYVKGIKQDMMEQILDRFDARQELPEGRTIIKQGELVSGGGGGGYVTSSFERGWAAQRAKLMEVCLSGS